FSRPLRTAMTQPAPRSASLPQANGYTVRRFYDAFNRRDWNVIADLLDANVEWFHIGRDETVRGAEAVLALIRSNVDVFPDARIEVQALHEAGEFVITECALAKGGGRLKALRKAAFCEITQFRGGRCVRGTTYADTMRLLLELGTPRAVRGLPPTGSDG